jgi:hypothetical protein
MVRVTIPGSTTFRAWCNSHLRKLARKEAPAAYHRVASTPLADGRTLYAQFRITIEMEKWAILDAPPPSLGSIATIAPNGDPEVIEITIPAVKE